MGGGEGQNMRKMRYLHLAINSEKLRLVIEVWEVKISYRGIWKDIRISQVGKMLKSKSWVDTLKISLTTCGFNVTSPIYNDEIWIYNGIYNLKWPIINGFLLTQLVKFFMVE